MGGGWMHGWWVIGGCMGDGLGCMDDGLGCMDDGVRCRCDGGGMIGMITVGEY